MYINVILLIKCIKYIKMEHATTWRNLKNLILSEMLDMSISTLWFHLNELQIKDKFL